MTGPHDPDCGAKHRFLDPGERGRASLERSRGISRNMPMASMKTIARALRRVVAGLALAASSAPWPASALVGPTREAPELAPYVVMVVDRRDMSYCTGTVIGRSIVLTAAHCVESPENISIYHPDDDDGEGTFLPTADVAVHPGYRPDAAQRRVLSIDLALVRLADPLPSHFRPVSLSDKLRVEIGQKLSLAGFGIADETRPKTGGVLREGTVEVRGTTPPFLVRLADPRGQGLGGCTGDSGAPIFAPGEPGIVAVAIWAKGEDGQRCGAATEAALVAPHRHWIEAILQSWARESRTR